MKTEKLEAAVEAILFAAGDSVDTGRIAKAIDQDPDSTRQLLQRLQRRYEEEGRGVRIVGFEDSWQMCTSPETFDYLVRIAKQPRRPELTDVVLETLSIIAYKQPVTKAELEKIRGVKCDHAVNKLLEYDLVQELGRLDAPGRPLLFGTTEEFLRSFGVHSLSELPPVNTVKMEDFKAEAEEEVRLTLKV